MSDTIFASLERLSVQDLDASIQNAAQHERKHVALVIAHLTEMSRRKAHLDLGYSSLFNYCLERLSLSEGSIGCRIQVANVCRDVPELLRALAEGRLSLTVSPSHRRGFAGTACDFREQR